jgi:inosine-uridine nucleoside N-ribohydrolase
VDFGGKDGREMNVDVVLDIDRPRFIDLIDAALRRLD